MYINIASALGAKQKRSNAGNKRDEFDVGLERSLEETTYSSVLPNRHDRGALCGLQSRVCKDNITERAHAHAHRHINAYTRIHLYTY